MLETFQKRSLRQPLGKPNKIPQLNPIIRKNNANLLQIKFHLHKPIIT